ncbi:MAG: biopolymer transporter ExbD [Chitinispirillaceae bacterium]|nr:biopolymer transporter ExbD [Chitinispirillaceae bacterium]
MNKQLRSSGSAAAEIDVTPIMNMFIILIPFLVSMAVFTHLAVLHFALPPNSGNGLSTREGKPKLKLTVIVAETYCAVTRGEFMLDSLVKIDGSYDLQRLAVSLARFRTGTDLSDEAIVAVRNSIEFDHVVQIMDICRAAGFSKIGLSSATEDPSTGI